MPRRALAAVNVFLKELTGVVQTMLQRVKQVKHVKNNGHAAAAEYRRYDDQPSDAR